MVDPAKNAAPVKGIELEFKLAHASRKGEGGKIRM